MAWAQPTRFLISFSGRGIDRFVWMMICTFTRAIHFCQIAAVYIPPGSDVTRCRLPPSPWRVSEHGKLLCCYHHYTESPLVIVSIKVRLSVWLYPSQVLFRPIFGVCVSRGAPVERPSGRSILSPWQITAFHPPLSLPLCPFATEINQMEHKVYTAHMVLGLYLCVDI